MIVQNTLTEKQLRCTAKSADGSLIFMIAPEVLDFIIDRLEDYVSICGDTEKISLTIDVARILYRRDK